MDDALVLELGADIMGCVPDVFVNADGVKKSKFVTVESTICIIFLHIRLL